MLSSKWNPRAPGKGRISERDWDQESAVGVASEGRSKGCAGRYAKNLARRGEGTCEQSRELGTGCHGGGRGRDLGGNEARSSWRCERSVELENSRTLGADVLGRGRESRSGTKNTIAGRIAGRLALSAALPHHTHRTSEHIPQVRRRCVPLGGRLEPSVYKGVMMAGRRSAVCLSV